MSLITVVFLLLLQVHMDMGMGIQQALNMLVV